MDATDERWLYASSSSDKTVGAELVRDAKFGRALRGVEAVDVTFVPKLDEEEGASRDVEDEVVRCGRTLSPSI